MQYYRPIKYNRPARDVLLDIFNFTNKAAFEKHQLEFGIPQAIDYHYEEPSDYPTVIDYTVHRPEKGTLTKIQVSPSATSSWTKSIELTYSRIVMQDHFKAVPFVVYAKSLDKENILKALLDQYNLFLDADLFEYRLEVVDMNSIFFTTHVGSIVDNEVDCSLQQPPVSWNVILTAMEEHPIFVGHIVVHIREAIEFLDRDVKKTLEVKRFMGEGNHDKMPAEMILPMNRFVDHDHSLKNYKVGDLVLEGIVEVAKEITGDRWVFDNRHAPFNLYGATVVYNGLNTGDVYINDPKCTNLLIVQFSNYSTNLVGQWIIGYYSRETYLRQHRVDFQPFRDM